MTRSSRPSATARGSACSPRATSRGSSSECAGSRSSSRRCRRPTEKLSLADALEDGEAGQRFFKTLFDLLAAPEPDQARFAALAKAVAALGPAAKESGWPLVTLLPFVAQPDRHLVLRPKLTCEAANRLGLELHYDPSPNAETYASLLASAELLLESLQPLGARDYVDVESFMHIATTKAGRAKSPLRLVT